jgi:hypothetical protein
MIPIEKIRELIDLRKTPAKEIKLSDLQAKFSPTTAPVDGQRLPVPTVTRLVFVDGNIFRYVLHSSTLNAFLLKLGATPTGTFEDLRSDPDMLHQISRLVVFIAANSTLSDARALMDRVDGAQDIIITLSGNSSEPMVGWITNVDLVRELNGP